MGDAGADTAGQDIPAGIDGLAQLSEDLGEAMVGINEQEITLLMAERGQ